MLILNASLEKILMPRSHMAVIVAPWLHYYRPGYLPPSPAPMQKVGEFWVKCTPQHGEECKLASVAIITQMGEQIKTS